MQNADIIEVLELTAKLLELHGENEFKIRTYSSAAFQLDKSPLDLVTTSVEDLIKTPGVGKSMALKIEEIRTTGQLAELNDLLARTPEGVIEMFKVQGIGAKKIRQIWLEVGIDNLHDLLLACEDNRIAHLKGFGERTQATIRESLLFLFSNASKLRMDKAEALAQVLYDELEKQFSEVEMVGELRRKSEVVSVIQLVVGAESPMVVQRLLNSLEFLQQDEAISSPFVWRGKFVDKAIPIEVLICTPSVFQKEVFIHTAAPAHLAQRTANGTLLQVVQKQAIISEEEVYEKAGVPFVIPEMREGTFELDWLKTHQNEELITWEALKGILHNHSTYSDGKHSLAEMARFCKELGFDYLGIADHSKTASYANGLNEYRVKQQHEEIERLNAELAPFKILKGIESDILADGSLDYTDDILASFDYVVASVHQNLKMDKHKATQRLLRAIENPYTTILGHPTGRLLLSREGYPVDYKVIIDACAEKGVVIEINASPYRLDLDWRWIQYCLDKGVMLSINPDAHEKDGYFDMHYGVAIARKGGLTKAMTFNALSLNEMEAYLAKRRP
ncbi:MAG: PHP domain-containing protein [Spirosomataceae bacterium]